MEKAQEILFHIDELYSENPSEELILQMAEKNPVRYQAWVDAFNDYDLSDVLQAIDNYWEFKNSKTKPNVAQIKATLEQHRIEKLKTLNTEFKPVKGDYSWERMAQDTKDGTRRNNLYVYQDAEKIVLEDWLLKEIPTEVWKAMSYASRLKVAMEKGLFNDFEIALKLAAQKRFDRDYEYPSENDTKSAEQIHEPVLRQSDRSGGLQPLKSHYGVAV